MKCLSAALATTLITVALATSAQADPSEYGIDSASASTTTTQAADHPDFTIFFKLKKDPEGLLPSTTRDVSFELPPGLLGNPNAMDKCTAAQLIGTDPEDPSNETGCPPSSQVGVTEVELKGSLGEIYLLNEPIFNMVPRHGSPARFGFFAHLVPVMVDVELQPERQYSATARIAGASSVIALLAATSTIWGVPADESHDTQRMTVYEAIKTNGAPDTPDGKRSAGLVPVPYMLNPARCGVSQRVEITAIPYQLSAPEAKAFAPLKPNSGCGLLDFEPQMSIAPTTSQAETGSGLDVNLTFPTDGLEHPNLLGGAIQKRAEVTLPEGVTVNPSQAVGLGVCSEADFAKETADSLPNEGCPETAKIGSVSAKSPLVEETAEGALYIAKPKQNPFGTLIALYLVLKIPERGVIVKLAGKVEPDPTTGQLVTTFGEAGHEIPQLPVESFHLHFREGARSPLVTPPRCGSYISDAVFTAWSGQVVTTHPAFQITSGVGGSPCPSGTPPFEPGFEAGTLNDDAGQHSPFYMRLTRRDGDQDLTRFSAKLPPGLVAKLAGVSFCPDAALEAAKSKSGKAEQASPSCPASSEIGNVLAGAGVGQVLTYATGKIYLAGPYQGAPLSVAAIVPAVAGPFDVGTVVTRQALQLHPRTGVVSADGEHSDPIPHILAGIPLKVRDIRVYVDREQFTLNPTSCEPFAVNATLWAGGNDVFDSADDSPHALSQRFQAANCSRLGFRPRLAVRLKGGVRRGAHPGLKAVVTPRPGDANFSRAVVKLPTSAFLEQAHIRTICTRVQFAAGQGHGSQCPKGARYGYARAWSPLLDAPAQGPVFLRSSDNKLPDLVVALKGPASAPVDVELSARIDSVKGGIRSTFAAIPDLPVSRFVLQMQGGKKGLIVNSRHLCFKPKRNRAVSNIRGQNGRFARTRPRVVALTCAKRRKGGGKRGKPANGQRAAR